MKECYLDNCATTRVDDEVLSLMETLFIKEYGNPSSMHYRGFGAEKYMKGSASVIARALGVSEKNIIFTSGGTESDNMAILGTALSHEHSGRHIITTAIEHPAVREPVKFLEKRGWRVSILHVDSNGVIDPGELEQELGEDTVLVSIMHVNNETGALQPVEEAGKLIRKKAPACLFHVDDVQAFGKIPLFPSRCGIDFLSASSHKIHGPKGTGLLYFSDRAVFSPLILGGGQMGGRRSGTENVPGIAGFARAAKLMYEGVETNMEHFRQLRKRLTEGAEEIGGIRVNGALESTAPYIVSMTLPGIRAEVFLHAMEEKGICVSAGSACSSNKPRASETLKAMGLEGPDLESTVRFSFSKYTTCEEIDYTLDVMRQTVPVLSRFRRH